jgi:hypothetical protein
MLTDPLHDYLSARDPLRHGAADDDASRRQAIYTRVIAQPRDSGPSPRHRPPRQLIRVTALASPVVAAVAVAIVLVLGASGTPGRGFPAAVAALARAAQDPNAVVHTIVQGDDVEGAPGAQREMWQTIDGSVTRYRTTQPDGDYQDVVFHIKGDQQLGEMYESTTNTLYQYPPTPAPEPTSSSDLSIGNIADYASAVEAGTAEVAGTTTVNGTPAYQVVQKGRYPQTWLVSTDASSPTLLRIDRYCAPTATNCQPTTFLLYQVTDNQSSLGFPAHPGARVVNLAAPAPGQAPPPNPRGSSTNGQ